MSTYTDTAGENLVAKNVCYRKSDGKLWKAKADAAATMPGIALASASISGDATGEFHARGKVTLTSHGFGDSGALLYVSEDTAGLLTSTAPTGSGEQVQIVGQIVDANTIDFSPNMMIVELA